MKILVHHHKYGDIYYDATDELWAFMELFKSLDVFEAYLDLDDEENDLYQAAKGGDKAAAKRLCIIRKNYEYEGWTLEDVKYEKW